MKLHQHHLKRKWVGCGREHKGLKENKEAADPLSHTCMSKASVCPQQPLHQTTQGSGETKGDTEGDIGILIEVSHYWVFIHLKIGFHAPN